MRIGDHDIYELRQIIGDMLNDTSLALGKKLTKDQYEYLPEKLSQHLLDKHKTRRITELNDYIEKVSTRTIKINSLCYADIADTYGQFVEKNNIATLGRNNVKKQVYEGCVTIDQMKEQDPEWYQMWRKKTGLK